MNQMTTETMAKWVWATQHPFLYTFIEVSTPTILLMFIFAQLLKAWVNVFSKKR